jgi:hypothetical protein
MKSRITKSDPEYGLLVNGLEGEGVRTVYYAGHEYMAVKDNEDIIFVLVGGIGTIERYYGSQSWPMSPKEKKSGPYK